MLLATDSDWLNYTCRAPCPGNPSSEPATARMPSTKATAAQTFYSRFHPFTPPRSPRCASHGHQTDAGWQKLIPPRLRKQQGDTRPFLRSLRSNSPAPTADGNFPRAFLRGAARSAAGRGTGRGAAPGRAGAAGRGVCPSTHMSAGQRVPSGSGSAASLSGKDGFPALLLLQAVS